MIDICTVVYKDEISALKLQAQSIDLYCNDIGIKNIYVVVNDDETVSQEIDPAWWGQLAAHVLIIPRTAFSTEWVTDGWVSQQVWKILTASISYNIWTMVLDAKTIFVRDLVVSDLLTTDGKLGLGLLPIYPVFDPSRRIVESLYGITMQSQIGPGGVPFFFHNDTVRFMIVETTLRTNKPFPRWFQEQGMLTEFLLYSGYCQHRYQGLENFVSDNTLGRVVNLCHSEPGSFDRKFAEMQQDDTLTVSIHRRAWQELSSDQKQQYRSFLIDRHIIGAWDLA
jgi:hypothetical protein